MASTDGSNRISKGPRACTVCARAKSKCLPGPSPGRCERCHRLNKPCGAQTPAPPRKRKEPKRTKVQQLEQRLEDLTVRLESAARHGTSPPLQSPATARPTTARPPTASTNLDVVKVSADGDPSGYEKRECDTVFRMDHLFPGTEVPLLTPPYGSPESAQLSVPSGCEVTSIASAGQVGRRHSSRTIPGITTSSGTGAKETGRQEGDQGDGGKQQPTPRPSEYLPGTQSPSIFLANRLNQNLTAGCIWPSGPEAASFLSTYRTHAVSLFPFVVIPENMVSDRLRVERPFLWKAIMMHACHQDNQRQVGWCTGLVKDLVVGSFSQASNSLDMLQGLLVLLAWFHYNMNSTQLTNMLFLARAMVATLDLCDKVLKHKLKPPPELTATQLDEARALAGTYYLLTLFFNANKKVDSLMDPSHIENSCVVLENRLGTAGDDGLAGDRMAIALCRVQILAHTIATSLIEASRQPHNLPFHILVSSFRERIHSFKMELPLSLADNPILSCHVSMAYILLCEPSICQSRTQYLSPSDRIPLLWQTLQAVKGYFAARFAHPMTDQPRFVCLTGFDFTYVFVTAAKLVLLNLPGWDVEIVKRELNLEPFIDRTIRETDELGRRRERRARVGKESAENGAPGTKAKDSFYRLGIKLRHLKDIFQCSPRGGAVSPTSTSNLVSEVTAAAEAAMGGGDGAGSPSTSRRCAEFVMAQVNPDVHGSGVDAPPVDGFDADYWHDVFNDDAMRFYTLQGSTQLFDVGMLASGEMQAPPSLDLGALEDTSWLS